MSRLSTVVIVGALAAVAAGCGGGTCPAPAAPAATGIAGAGGPPELLSIRLRDYEAEVCACKTLACADTADAELGSWLESHRDVVERAFGNVLREVQMERHLARVDACKRPLEDAAPDDEREGQYRGADAAIAKMGRIADAVCQCKDQACLDAQMKKMSSMKEPTGKPTKAQMEKAMKIAERMAECQKRIMTSNGTWTP